MSAGQLFLVIVSTLGVVHGLFLAVFLWNFRQGSSIANRILSLLLLVLSFRVGKSLFLEFTPDLDETFIFIGLGTMLAIGPLYYLYVIASLEKSFQIKSHHLLHFVPSLAGIVFGFWIEEQHLETLPMVFFAILFISYYLYYLLYLLLGFSKLVLKKKEGANNDVVSWLKIMFAGLFIVWIAYVLNLFDDQIPYVFGPVLYSIVAYSLSLIAIRRSYLQNIGQSKYKTTPISEEQVEVLFEKVTHLVVDEKLFKDAELTLKSLSERLHVSTQILSLVINQKSEMNYNSFINHHRIEEAIQLMNDTKNDNLTIAALAFEVGFNSLSSFNAAFKKQIGQTPKNYRETLTK